MSFGRRKRKKKPREHNALIVRVAKRSETPYPVRVACRCGWGPHRVRSEDTALRIVRRHREVFS